MKNAEQTHRIIRAKIELYRLILRIPADDLTDVEIEIGYKLAQDPDIQKILERGK